MRLLNSSFPSLFFLCVSVPLCFVSFFHRQRRSLVRWPLQRQLLVPVLSVVVAAIVASSALTAYLAAGWAAQRQEENLKRVVHTLTDAGFPLTEPVLSKMSGLSGADFVVFDGAGNLLAATISPQAGSLAALRRLPPQSRDTTIWDQPRLELADRDYLAARLLLDDARTGDSSLSLVVLYPADRHWTAHRQVILAPLVVGACAAIVVGIVVTILARRVVQPIQSLRGRALAISAGDFQQQPLPARNDEIRDLAQSINEMAERLERYAEQVRQNERLANARPIGRRIGASVTQLRHRSTHGAGPAPPAMQRRRTGRSPARRRKAVEAHGIVLAALSATGPIATGNPPTNQLASHRGRRGAAGSTRCEARESRFRRSASRSTGRNPGRSRRFAAIAHQLIVERHRSRTSEFRRPAARRGRGVRHDRWPGRADDQGLGSRAGPDVEPRMFEPFVTEKPDGTGLGLSMAREIAVEHGGSIRWQREAGMTCFVVQLPTTHREEQHGSIACCR